MAIEKSDMLAGGRHSLEASWNKVIRRLRQEIMPRILDGTFGNYKVRLEKEFTDMNPPEREFLEEVFTTAVKHNLHIKFAEEHSRKELAELGRLKAAQEKLFSNILLTESTEGLVGKVRDGLGYLQRYVELRDRAICKDNSKASS